MRLKLLEGLIRTPAGWAIVLGISVPVGAGLGPPFSRLPKLHISAGEAAAWGGFCGLIAAIALILLLPQRYIG